MGEQPTSEPPLLWHSRGMDALTLYVDSFWISPYAMSAFVALEEKGLPYAVTEVSLPDKAHHAASYRSRTNRVPALQHGDYWLSESQAIAEYVAETFPAPRYPRIFPEDLKQRGICREIMGWVRSDLMPLRNERSTHSIFYARTDQPLSSEARAAAAQLMKLCEALIQEGRTTLFADWCIADCDLTVMLQRLNLNGHPLPPKVKAYAEANWARPSLRKWTERPRKTYVPY
jgi:glutathione S-transferase